MNNQFKQDGCNLVLAVIKIAKERSRKPIDDTVAGERSKILITIYRNRA